MRLINFLIRFSKRCENFPRNFISTSESYFNWPVEETLAFAFFRKVYQRTSYAIKTIMVLAPNDGNNEQFHVDYDAPSRNSWYRQSIAKVCSLYCGHASKNDDDIGRLHNLLYLNNTPFSNIELLDIYDTFSFTSQIDLRKLSFLTISILYIQLTSMNISCLF